MGRALLLTGRPGVGKTTLVKRVIERLGARAGGFYTEEIREGGRRVGFRLVALDGRTGLLAGVNVSSPYRVGKYGVCIDDLERVGVQALKRAVERPAVGLVVVDEIGKMELFSAEFRAAAKAALASPKPVLATVMATSHPWVDALKARPDATVVEVTRSNRSELPDELLRRLEKREGIAADGT